MSNISVLVAAAGRGSRANLPYPKTLFLIHGKPILVRIFEVMSPYDVKPTVVVSSHGVFLIDQCLTEFGLNAHLVVQEKALGMGDAVLCFKQSPACSSAEHILLIWGDIPFIQKWA